MEMVGIRRDRLCTAAVLNGDVEIVVDKTVLGPENGAFGGSTVNAARGAFGDVQLVDGEWCLWRQLWALPVGVSSVE